ncbi:TasA family protein [Peribacillus glennii]|nr:TasA family protein [Peribacillus glennii]
MNIKKKLALFTGTGLLGVGLTIGGATYALFTDTTSNTNNTATAGTINLVANRNHGDYTPGPMFYPDSLDPDAKHPYDVTEITPSGDALGGWAPGDTVRRTMELSNTGSLDAKLTGIKATPRETYTQYLKTGGTRSVSGLVTGAEYLEFIEKANVLITNPDEEVTIFEGKLSELIFNDTNTYAEVDEELELAGVTPGFGSGPLNITFKVTLDKSASNAIQGKNFIFDFGFFAEQVRNNP